MKRQTLSLICLPSTPNRILVDVYYIIVIPTATIKHGGLFFWGGKSREETAVVVLLLTRGMEYFPVPSLDGEPVRDLGSDWTLLLPAVTVGNVGQLAVDLLLTSVQCRHIGRLRAPSLLPLAGSPPAPPAHKARIITPMEVYAITDPAPAQAAARTVYLVQQRTPPARGRAGEHARSVADWARAAGCREIVLLGSANAAGRREAQLREAADGARLARGLRIAATTPALAPEMLGERARGAMAWRVMEGVGSDPRGWTPDCDEAVEEDRVSGTGAVAAFSPLVRRGGFVRTLLETCEKLDVALTVLMLFVHEGDNTQDACVLASAVASLLTLPLAETGANGKPEELEDPLVGYITRWRIPPSWQQASAPPLGLY